VRTQRRREHSHASPRVWPELCAFSRGTRRGPGGSGPCHDVDSTRIGSRPCPRGGISRGRAGGDPVPGQEQEIPKRAPAFFARERSTVKSKTLRCFPVFLLCRCAGVHTNGVSLHRHAAQRERAASATPTRARSRLLCRASKALVTGLGDDASSRTQTVRLRSLCAEAMQTAGAGVFATINAWPHDPGYAPAA
jgi:hypothetical protein